MYIDGVDLLLQPKFQIIHPRIERLRLPSDIAEVALADPLHQCMRAAFDLTFRDAAAGILSAT